MGEIPISLPSLSGESSKKSRCGDDRYERGQRVGVEQDKNTRHPSPKGMPAADCVHPDFVVMHSAQGDGGWCLVTARREIRLRKLKEKELARLRET